MQSIYFWNLLVKHVLHPNKFSHYCNYCAVINDNDFLCIVFQNFNGLLNINRTGTLETLQKVISTDSIALQFLVHFFYIIVLILRKINNTWYNLILNLFLICSYFLRYFSVSICYKLVLINKNNTDDCLNQTTGSLKKMIPQIVNSEYQLKKRYNLKGRL